jgi:hypothetical protein
VEMTEEGIDIDSRHNVKHYGIEDIRLYTYKDKIRFIGSSVNYATNDTFNVMMVGDYDIDRKTLCNATRIYPPNYSYCEKNWIPIVKNDIEYMIYKWNPMEIGIVDGDTNKLRIVMRYDTNKMFGKLLRGSSGFIELDGDTLVGICHFCDDSKNPRSYFHVLIALEKETLRPIKHSKIFNFKNFGIEYCIGINIEKDDYMFWTSIQDQDTTFIRIPIKDIPLSYDFTSTKLEL